MMKTDRSRGLAGLLLGAVLAAGSMAASAQTKKPVGPAGAIFTCTNAAGRTLTSDRPIAECLDREQRVLNRDGSLRTTLQPSLTSDERAALEEEERRVVRERIAKQDAIRRDRNLLARYPDQATHDKARSAALDDVQSGIKASQQRLADLQKERKPLVDESEFYVGKPLPVKLKNQLDSVDVSIEAQTALIANQQVEVGRITALFDAELGRLKQLWGGADPGSLGPLPQSAQATAPVAAPKKKP